MNICCEVEFWERVHMIMDFQNRYHMGAPSKNDPIQGLPPYDKLLRMNKNRHIRFRGKII